MKLVAVTRTRSEDDILEAFVRHHAALVDAHVFVDNGSADGTAGILGALQAEGLGLDVYENRSLLFTEAAHNTQLLHFAARGHGADWVLFLDTDEFIDARGLGDDLRGWLAGLPDAVEAVRVPLVNYQETVADDAAEPNVARRMRWRWPEGGDVFKVFVRGRLTRANVLVGHGNHGVTVDGRDLEAPLETRIRLAHYYRRSAWQELTKVAVGRLRLIATGQATVAQGHLSHYQTPFEMLKTRPAELLHSEWATPKSVAGLVEDPIRYLGGALRHTHPADPQCAALASLLSYAEQLARQHGHLLDTNLGVRTQVEAGNAAYYRRTPTVP